MSGFVNVVFVYKIFFKDGRISFELHSPRTGCLMFFGAQNAFKTSESYRRMLT